MAVNQEDLLNTYQSPAPGLGLIEFAPPVSQITPQRAEITQPPSGQFMPAAPAPVAPVPQKESAVKPPPPPSNPAAIETYTFSPEFLAAQKNLYSVFTKFVNDAISGNPSVLSSGRRMIQNSLAAMSQNILGGISAQAAVGNVSGGQLTGLYKQGLQRILAEEENLRLKAIEDIAAQRNVSVQQAAALMDAITAAEKLRVDEYQKARALGFEKEQWAVMRHIYGVQIMSNLLNLVEEGKLPPKYLFRIADGALQGSGINLPPEIEEIAQNTWWENLSQQIDNLLDSGWAWEYTRDENGNVIGVQPKLDKTGAPIRAEDDQELKEQIGKNSYDNIVSYRTAATYNKQVVVPGIRDNGQLYIPAVGTSVPEDTILEMAEMPNNEIAIRATYQDGSGTVRYFNRNGQEIDSKGNVLPAAEMTVDDYINNWESAGYTNSSQPVVDAYNSNNPTAKAAAVNYTIKYIFAQNDAAQLKWLMAKVDNNDPQDAALVAAIKILSLDADAVGRSINYNNGAWRFGDISNLKFITLKDGKMLYVPRQATLISGGSEYFYAYDSAGDKYKIYANGINSVGVLKEAQTINH